VFTASICTCYSALHLLTGLIDAKLVVQHGARAHLVAIGVAVRPGTSVAISIGFPASSTNRSTPGVA